MDIKHVSGTDQRAARQQKQQQDRDQPQDGHTADADSQSGASQPDQLDVDHTATLLYELIESHLPDAQSIVPWFIHNAYPRNNITLLNLARMLQEKMTQQQNEQDFNLLMTQVRRHVSARIPHMEPPYEAFHLKTGLMLEPLVTRGRLFPANLLEEAEKQLLEFWVKRIADNTELLDELSLLTLAFSFERWQQQIKGHAPVSLSLNSFTRVEETPMGMIISPTLRQALQD